MEFDLRPVHVPGIQGRDAKIARLVRKVLVLSCTAVVVAITLAILNFTIFRDQNGIAQTVVSLMIGVTIPLFGWLGAWMSDRGTDILVMVGIDYTMAVLRNCYADGTVIIDGQITTSVCKRFTEDWLRKMYIIASAVSIPMILLQCVSGVFGGRLYGHMSPSILITYQVDPPTNVVGTAYTYPQATVVSNATVIGSPAKSSGKVYYEYHQSGTVSVVQKRIQVH